MFIDFFIVCVCFFLTSTLTEFLNLLQTNLYKINVKKKKCLVNIDYNNNKNDSLSLSSSDDDDDDDNVSVKSNLLKMNRINKTITNNNRSSSKMGRRDYYEALNQNTDNDCSKFKKYLFFLTIICLSFKIIYESLLK